MSRKTALSCSFFLGLAPVFVLLLSGCSGSSGPPRYEVSGAVTYNGKPVPAGEVSFQPDASKGNKGPGSLALIKDGRYKTNPKKGVVGGPYIVRILGFDGVAVGDSSTGKTLFDQYETKVEFPKQATTQDFSVPASTGAPGSPQKGGFSPI